MAAESDRLVSLKGGLVVPIEPIRLVLDLEARGFALSRDGDDIFVRPFTELTESDKRQLKLWKPQVLTLLDYEAPKF